MVRELAERQRLAALGFVFGDPIYNGVRNVAGVALHQKTKIIFRFVSEGFAKNFCVVMSCNI